MSLKKKQRIDWCDDFINQIDIKTENFLLNSTDENENNSINQIRELMVAKLKEIERFNWSNETKRKYAYLAKVHKSNDHELTKNNKIKAENLLGNLVILNQDFSHLFKSIRYKNLSFKQLFTLEVSICLNYEN